MKTKIDKEKLNFSDESQKLFDSLCEKDDYSWTWYGMAKAFCKRFGYNDIEEFVLLLQTELKNNAARKGEI